MFVDCHVDTGTPRKHWLVYCIYLRNRERALWQRREMNVCCGGLASTLGRSVATDTQLEVETPTGKLEAELRLEKDM